MGVIYDRAHIRDIGILEGLTKRMGLTAGFFAVAGLTSLGLPGLSGFVAEVMVFIGVFQDYPLLGVLGIVGAAITAVYILRLLSKVFFGPLDPRVDPSAGRQAAYGRHAARGLLGGDAGPVPGSRGRVPEAVDRDDRQRRGPNPG